MKYLLFLLLILGCTKAEHVYKYKFMDEVKILQGFYKDCTATVLSPGGLSDGGYEYYNVNLNCEKAYITNTVIILKDYKD